MLYVFLKLNRDTWGNEAVSQTISSNFIFWQVSVLVVFALFSCFSSSSSTVNLVGYILFRFLALVSFLDRCYCIYRNFFELIIICLCLILQDSYMIWIVVSKCVLIKEGKLEIGCQCVLIAIIFFF